MYGYADRCTQARRHETLYRLDHRLRRGHDVVHNDGEVDIRTSQGIVVWHTGTGGS